MFTRNYRTSNVSTLFAYNDVSNLQRKNTKQPQFTHLESLNNQSYNKSNNNTMNGHYLSLLMMPSPPTTPLATLSLKCQSFRVLMISRMPLLDAHQTQLIIIISLTTYKGNWGLLPLPLTPNIDYQEIHLYRTNSERENIGEPLRIAISYPSKMNPWQITWRVMD